VFDLTALEIAARDVLDAMAYDYIAGGADQESTLADNQAAWRRFRLVPHVLRDVSAVSTEVSLFGGGLRTPVMVAPVAYQRLAHPGGEEAMARGAAEAGALMCVSTMATISLEDIARTAPEAPKWFQLYVHRDRGLTAEFVRRAESAGYEAVVFTVDLAVLGRRIRDERNRFALPPGLEMANLGRTVPESEGSALDAYADEALDPGLTYADVEWLRELTDLPVIVKGIVRADDADAAVRAGAHGIVVSNHGGRQLDTCIATADALRDVVSAVDGRVPVLVDGGIRNGTDIVKALALGAAAVLVGRPVLWALAVDGSEGVARVLEDMRVDLVRAMALCGAASIDELTEDLVV